MNFASNNSRTPASNMVASSGSARKTKEITVDSNHSNSSKSDMIPRKMNKSYTKDNDSSGKNGGNPNPKHRRHSNSSNNSNERDNKRPKLESMEIEPIFPKLDQGDPAHARRIQQRRKNIAMGKNTQGYFQYTKQVPKHRRKKRSMETPSTPDHTLDIPTKRWQGMVKAWRKALHQYDPPEMVAKSVDSEPDKPGMATKIEADDSLQTRQIKDALAKGLLVDVTTPAQKASAAKEDDDLGSPFSVLSTGSGSRNIMDMDVGAEDFDDGDDSDDDLL